MKHTQKHKQIDGTIWTKDMPFKKSPVLRNKSSDILSMNDYYRKRTDIIEEICGVKIDLSYKNTGSNYVYQKDRAFSSKGDLDTYEINISKPAVKCIPSKTALYHELSHVLHKTFLTGMLAKMREMAKDICIEKYEEVTGKEYTTTLVPASATVSNWSDSLYELYKVAFNILEDQRIESLTSQVWLGTQPMFMDMRKKLGDKLLPDVDERTAEDPTCQLLMYRFLHPECCTTDALSFSIDKVEGCNESGAVILWKRKIKPVLDAYFFKKLKEKRDARDKDNVNQQLPEDISSSSELESIKEDRDTKREQLTELEESKEVLMKQGKVFEKDSEGNVDTTKHTKEFEDLEVSIDELNEEIDVLNSKIWKSEEAMENAERNEGKLSECLQGMVGTKHTTMANDGKYMKSKDANEENELDLEYSQALEGEDNNLSIEHELSESKKEGKTQVSEIKNAISGMQVPKEPAHIHKEKRVSYDNKPQPNNQIVNGLVGILRKIKEKNVTTIDESGDEVDVDSYINVKQKGFGNAFETIKTDNGLPIMITIDGSGSMSHSSYGATNIEKARDLVASLFKVSQQHQEITVQANVWSSNSSGDVAITDIKTLHDCNQISCGVNSNAGYYETPTHEGIKYSTRKLKEMRGRNKMLILITDGYPQFSKNGTHFGKNVITKLCKDAYKQALTVTPNILCINIEKRSYTAQEMLTTIFGKNYVEFNGMDEASEFVNKTLKRKIVEIYGR